ncbi:hypothetical protein CKAH01_19128, partial [Colletotrichum kahawae]
MISRRSTPSKSSERLRSSLDFRSSAASRLGRSSSL